MRSDLLRLSLSLALAVGSAVATAADPPPAEGVTAAGLLTTFERTVAQLSCVHLEATQTAVVVQSAGAGAERVRTETGSQADFTLYRDRYRWRLSSRNRSELGINAKKRETVFRSDFLLGEQLVIAQKWEQAADGPKIPLHDMVQGQLNASGVESSLRTHLAGGDILLFGHAAPLRGQPLWRVVRGAETLQLLPEMEEVDGIRTHVLRSVSREGTRTMWLDPSQGCLPRRIEIHHPQNDVDFLYRYDKIRIERKQDLPIIMAFDVVTKTTGGDGTETETRREFQVKAIDFDPAAWPATAFQGSIEIPNGTPVLMRQDGGGAAADYEWRNGRIRAKE